MRYTMPREHKGKPIRYSPFLRPDTFVECDDHWDANPQAVIELVEKGYFETNA